MAVSGLAIKQTNTYWIRRARLLHRFYSPREDTDHSVCFGVAAIKAGYLFQGAEVTGKKIFTPIKGQFIEIVAFIETEWGGGNYLQ